MPRRSQNRLSKPRTNTSTLNLLSTNVPAAAASRRNSSSFVPLAASDKRTSFVAPEIIVDDSNANPVKSNLSTRRRLRDHLFRSKSSDGRSRGSSIVTQEELARDAAVDRWHHTETSNGQIRDDGQLRSVEIERFVCLFCPTFFCITMLTSFIASNPQADLPAAADQLRTHHIHIMHLDCHLLLKHIHQSRI